MKISLEQLEVAVRVNFHDFVRHPEKRLRTNVVTNGAAGIAVAVFVGISKKLNIPAADVCLHLRISQDEYCTQLDKYLRYTLDEHGRPGKREKLKDITIRKSALVCNYLKNYYRLTLQ